MYAKKDGNHKEIQRFFLKHGGSWADTCDNPGSLDGLLGYKGVNVLIEIKNGSQSASRRTYTPMESERILNWKGFPCATVHSLDEAQDLLDYLDGRRKKRPRSVFPTVSQVKACTRVPIPRKRKPPVDLHELQTAAYQACVRRRRRRHISRLPVLLRAGEPAKQ